MIELMVNPAAMEDVGGVILINYRTFLENFTATLEPDYQHGINGASDSNIFVEAFYSQHKKLEAVFRFFDKDCDGIISSDEFRTGCQIINETLPDDQRLADIDRILSLLDTDESGYIDVNEFFEMFRLSEGVHSLSDSLAGGRASLPHISSMQSIDSSIDNNNDSSSLRRPSSMQHVPSFINPESPSSTSQRASASGRRRQLSGQFSPISRQDSTRTSFEVKGIVINIEGAEADVEDTLRQIETTAAVDI
jgi:hypothetical protein